MHELYKKIDELPEELKKEVSDFVDFLTTYKKGHKKKMKFDWMGGLSDLKDKFTSVELQHKSSEWRKGNVPH